MRCDWLPGWWKLANSVDYHATQVCKTVYSNLQNEKHKNANSFTTYCAIVSCRLVGLYFDANVVQ